jgi:hypothetical protein
VPPGEFVVTGPTIGEEVEEEEEKEAGEKGKEGE